MSLEEALAKNTAAMEKMTAVMEKLVAGGTKAATDKAATGTKPAATGTKPATKPADKKKSGPTIEEVAERVSAYLKVADSDERAAHKEHVAHIIGYYGVPKFTAIPADDIPTALRMLDEFEAGNTPAEFASEGDASDEGGEDDDGMV